MQTVTLTIDNPQALEQATTRFAESHMNLNEAFNVFLLKVASSTGYVFDSVTNYRMTDDIREAMAEVDAIIADPNRTGYRTAAELFAAMDAEDEMEELL